VARGPNRRRVDREAPAPPPGALRQGLKLALLWSVAGAAAVAGLAAGWRHLQDGDALRIRAIRTGPLARASAAELLALSPVRVGDGWLSADVEAMEQALSRHPWVREVRVRRAWPPSLEVKVTEREPRALVDLGGLYLVDDRGEVFKRAVPGDGLDLPVVTGISREAWVERRADVEPLLSAALALLARWAERGLDRSAPVSEIHIDPDFGTTIWAGDDGLEVRLGHGELPDKLERLERVLSALSAEGQRAEVLHLDNRRRPDWVAVRLKTTGPRGP